MKKVIIKKKMLYALLIPYIALGFIATIVFAKIYANSIDVINSEVMGNSYGTINKISKEIDYLVEDIERLVIEIGSNTRFRKMLSIEKEDRSKVDNYNIAMGIDELRKINKYNRLIENLSLYYHNGDFCINIESIRTVQGLLEDYDFNDQEKERIIVFL
ncbi:MAG: hypothetical protein RR618_05805, partial [Cellulosilyticaceae bacterium]